MKEILFAVEHHPDGDKTLTVFEEKASASLDLSPNMAKHLSELLLAKPDYDETTPEDVGGKS